MSAGDELNKLRLRVYHSSLELYTQDSGPKVSSQAEKSSGKLLIEIFPPASIKLIDSPGDEVTLPTALILKIVLEGRFARDQKPIAVQSAPLFKIVLNDGRCLHCNVLFDPADNTVHSVRSDAGPLELPQAERFKALIPKLKKGMTRAQVEKIVSADGGITVPFRYERYLVPNSQCGDRGEVVKVNVAFKPAGMSDAIYYLGKWVVAKQSPDDVLERISPAYLEQPIYD